MPAFMNDIQNVYAADTAVPSAYIFYIYVIHEVLHTKYGPF